jgi:hypothetical protein
LNEEKLEGKQNIAFIILFINVIDTDIANIRFFLIDKNLLILMSKINGNE